MLEHDYPSRIEIPSPSIIFIFSIFFRSISIPPPLSEKPRFEQVSFETEFPEFRGEKTSGRRVLFSTEGEWSLLRDPFRVARDSNLFGGGAVNYGEEIEEISVLGVECAGSERDEKQYGNLNTSVFFSATICPEKYSPRWPGRL